MIWRLIWILFQDLTKNATAKFQNRSKHFLKGVSQIIFFFCFWIRFFLIWYAVCTKSPDVTIVCYFHYENNNIWGYHCCLIDFKKNKDTAYKVKGLVNCILITYIQGSYMYYLLIISNYLTGSNTSCCLIDFHKTNFGIMHSVVEFNLAFVNVLTKFLIWILRNTLNCFLMLFLY